MLEDKDFIKSCDVPGPTKEAIRAILLYKSEVTSEDKVIDCGCGTGILGIIALKMGAKSVVGYDIDEWSADNSRHNAVINGVGDDYDARLGDAGILEPSLEFDIILANINRNILIADMPKWQPLLAKGGKLIISGFYSSDVEALVGKATELGLCLEARQKDGNWEAITFRNEGLGIRN